jgi:hypothetical protein
MSLGLIVLQYGLSLAGLICVVGAYQGDPPSLNTPHLVLGILFFAAAFAVRVHRWTRRRW